MNLDKIVADHASSNGSFKVALKPEQVEMMDRYNQQMTAVDEKVKQGLSGFLDLITNAFTREGLQREARVYIEGLRKEYELGQNDLTYDPNSKELIAGPADGQRQPDSAS